MKNLRYRQVTGLLLLVSLPAGNRSGANAPCHTPGMSDMKVWAAALDHKQDVFHVSNRFHVLNNQSELACVMKSSAFIQHDAY